MRMNVLEWLRWLVLLSMKTAHQYKGSEVQFTFPGTYWCGPGNFSNSADDLGYLMKTDGCCREHDHCPISIKANQSKYGLINDLPYTNSDCACDEAFFDCLRNVHSNEEDELSARLIEMIYFDLLEDRCIERASPASSVRIECQIVRNSEKCRAFNTSDKIELGVWKIFHPSKKLTRDIAIVPTHY